MAQSKIADIFHALYRFHYGLGLHTMRMFSRMDRGIYLVPAT